MVAALERILLAYSEYNQNLGYCQGMNFLAGVLLLVQPTEAEAFAMFVVTIEQV